MISITASELY